jgi:hypothetical protein
MGAVRNWRKSIVILPCIVAAVSTFGSVRGPGEYSGVVIFDRWGVCHLYSGVYLMEISEKVKASLRPFQSKAVRVNAQEVYQPINPGDGLITKLQVLGPARETVSAHFGGPPNLDDLSLRVIPNFPPRGTDELIIELRNDGKNRREINTDSLGPTLLSRKQGLECFDPSDGPSYAAVTRSNITLLHDGPAGGSCLVDGKGRTVKLGLLPGFAISRRFELDPGQSIEVPLRFELSTGQYEFLAGYGGGVHEVRVLVSNLVDFDVDRVGKGHLTNGFLASNQVRAPRRVGEVCGRITLENGNPAGQAQVFLWPFPVAAEEPRAANTAVAEGDGWFRMKSVLKGTYVLGAILRDSNGVFVGAFGGSRPADAAALSVPDSSEGCSSFVTVHPEPVYTVRGHTQARDASSAERTARIIMTKGNAFPFEATVVVQPDGRYEFRNVPAGRYQFFAGWTGSGFDVRSDIDDVGVIIKWPEGK